MTDAGRWQPPPPPPLPPRAAHVWRVRLDAGNADELHDLLSSDESARADAFAFPALRQLYIVAHGMLRRILAHYAELPPASLEFEAGTFGKPMLANAAARDLSFNLSHSGSLALIAVARGHDVGVDVERWSDRTAPAALAPRVFSPAEFGALAAMSPDAVSEGFYAAWTRKEAYMKATGHGISRGFDHFDVTLSAGEPPRILADRLDASAPSRWIMRALDVGAGYSAALVAAAPIDDVLLFDAPAAGALHSPP